MQWKCKEKVKTAENWISCWQIGGIDTHKAVTIIWRRHTKLCRCCCHFCFDMLYILKHWSEQNNGALCLGTLFGHFFWALFLGTFFGHYFSFSNLYFSPRSGCPRILTHTKKIFGDPRGGGGGDGIADICSESFPSCR
jgi:hypothetical protein